MVRSPKKRYLLYLLGCMGICAVIVLVANLLVVVPNRAGCHNTDDAVPHRPVILVLGAHPKSWYLKKRLDAAALLFKASKAETILVSGGSDGIEYDEAGAMKSMLEERGVPKAAILCDHHGNRTLDSVVRAKEVFGFDSVIIVSQSFHNPRALYFADSCGMDAVAFNAQTPNYSQHWRIELREIAARCLALWQVCVGTRPLHEKER